MDVLIIWVHDQLHVIHNELDIVVYVTGGWVMWNICNKISTVPVVTRGAPDLKQDGKSDGHSHQRQHQSLRSVP
eukprot:7064091-Ditylum_brightwellii.AAC.1